MVPKRCQLAQSLWHQLDRDGRRHDDGQRGAERPGVPGTLSRGPGRRGQQLTPSKSLRVGPSALGPPSSQAPLQHGGGGVPQLLLGLPACKDWLVPGPSPRMLSTVVGSSDRGHTPRRPEGFCRALFGPNQLRKYRTKLIFPVLQMQHLLNVTHIFVQRGGLRDDIWLLFRLPVGRRLLSQGTALEALSRGAGLFCAPTWSPHPPALAGCTAARGKRGAGWCARGLRTEASLPRPNDGDTAALPARPPGTALGRPWPFRHPPQARAHQLRSTPSFLSTRRQRGGCPPSHLSHRK